MKVRPSLLGLFFLLVAFYTASAQQCTIRVPQDQASLFLAAGQANDGDTVCVAPGIYQGTLIINNAISLIATSNDPTKTILESDDGQSVIFLNSDSSLPTTISGFTIRDATDQYNGAISASGDSVLSVRNNIFINDALAFNGETVDFENNTVSGIPAGVHCEANGGVQISGITNHTDGNGNPLTSYIAHNTFTGSGAACAGYGIQPIPGNGVTIEDNRFTGLYYGIVIPAAVPTTQVAPQIIRQNLFYGNTDGAIDLAHDTHADGTSTPPADVYILNNTFVNNLAAPDSATNPAAVKFTNFANIPTFSTPAGAIVFANNIISEPSESGVALDCGTLDTQDPATLPVVSNNIIWASNGTAVKGDCGPSKFLVNQDPKLVSATDLHPASGSPAIDAGNNSTPNLAATDFDGNARIQGANSVPVIDIGAYEISKTSGTAYATGLTPSTYVVTDTTPITLTAKVTAGGSADSGSVSFYRLDGSSGTLLGTQPVVGGTATLTSVSVPLTGNNTYYAISTRGVQSLPVYVDSTYAQPIHTTLSLVSSVNPSSYGQSVTFTATVSPEQSGTVNFFDGNTQIGTATLSNGTAMYSTASLPVGTHPITAKFQPASGSIVTNSLTQTVQAVMSSTTLVATPTTVTVGAAVQLHATISAPFGTVVSGTVTFMDNGIAVGSTQSVSGTTSTNVTISTSNLAIGTHTITATFTPASNSQAGASTGSASVTVQAVVTLGIDSTSNPSIQGQSVTFTATLPRGTTGNVSFSDGATSLGTQPIGSNGTASVATRTLSIGMHTITVTYTPASGSVITQSMTQTVEPNNSTTTIIATPTTVTVGGKVQLAGTVSTAAGVSISGSLTFRDGQAILATQNVNGTGSVQAAYTITSIATTGTHTITATFTPNSSSQAGASTSSPITVTVNAAVVPASVTTISAIPNPSLEGTQVPVTINVNGPAGSVISGVVKLYEGRNLLNTATVSGTTSAVASYTTTYSVGAHTLTAIFTPNGTATVQGSTSQSYILTITSATPPGTPDFTATISPGSLSVTVDQPTTATLSFTPLGNFTGSLTLSCGTLPPNVTCQLPQTVALDGKTTVTATLTLNATEVATNEPLHKGWIAAAVLTPALFSLRKRRQIAVLLCATLALFALAGCGTVVQLYSAPHTVTITANGTSQGTSTAVTHTVPVNFSVHL